MVCSAENPLAIYTCAPCAEVNLFCIGQNGEGKKTGVIASDRKMFIRDDAWLLTSAYIAVLVAFSGPLRSAALSRSCIWGLGKLMLILIGHYKVVDQTF